MIFEQTLINPNFVGKDGFRWFLGLTSGESDNYTNYGTRTKIRILGYHGEDIEEKDLPWAHVLVPLTMGGGRQMVQGGIQSSTLVVGFFADGDDGQQPIVIGAFYDGGKTEFGDYDGSKYLKMFKSKKAPLNPNNIATETSKRIVKTSTGPNTAGITSTTGVPTPKNEVAIGGEVTSSAAAEQLKQQNKVVISRPSHCKDSGTGFSKIMSALTNFIKVLNTVNQVTNGFINPLLNKLTNLDSEIEQIGILISDWLINQFKWVRDEVIKAIYKLLKTQLDKIKLPPWAEKIKQAAVGELTDGIWCAIGKVLKKIKDYIIEFLFGLIGNIVSIPLCAAGAFIGSAIQTITNEISDAIGSILDEVSGIVGGIGTVSSYVNKALGYAKGALSFLSCDEGTCKEEYDYKLNEGFIPKGTIDDFQEKINLYGAQGVSNLLDDASASKWLGDFAGDGNATGLGEELSGVESLISDCNVFSFECGPPTVTFFGGGGSGAAGYTVVDAVGEIIGVNITNGGSGYSEPPYVSFEDPCDNGSDAYATAVINSDGEVTDVIMYYSGSGYLTSSTENATDTTGTTGTTGTAGTTGTTGTQNSLVDSSGSTVTGTISGVVIENTGSGYTKDDKIYDSSSSNDVEIYPVVDDQGRIIDVNIINPGTSINRKPSLQINSQTGSGAVLLATLRFKKVEDVSIKSSGQNVETVIYCSENHG